MNENIYLPPGSVSLSSVTERPQIRLGLQGYPKTGKTWAALTFPNPIVLNLDRGLGAHVGKANVHEIPMYAPAFVDSVVKRNGAVCPPNRKDAVTKWLSTEALRLKRGQTLVIDGSTSLELAHDTQFKLDDRPNSNGVYDQWGVYKSKNVYFAEITTYLKSLECDVVYICHETPDRNKNGDLNGLVRPLLAGQAGDKLAGEFTDWFRTNTIGKPKTPEEVEKFKKFFGLTAEGFKEWMDKSTTDTVYYWQTSGDDIAKCGSSSLVNAPKYVLADYTTFSKYLYSCLY